jgi:hypothetical protein
VASRRRHDDRPIGRRAPTRAPKVRILILCEGQETEHRYFEAFNREVRNPRVVVKVANQRGDPLFVVKLAVRLRDKATEQAKRERDENLRWDEVWAVFDVDEHMKLEEAKKLARECSISLAVSNPCFELWALLHFQDQRAHVERRKVAAALKRHMPGYDKVLDFAKMHPGYERALQRAVDLSREADRAGDPDRNPTTGVPRLTELIRTR